MIIKIYKPAEPVLNHEVFLRLETDPVKNEAYLFAVDADGTCTGTNRICTFKSRGGGHIMELDTHLNHSSFESRDLHILVCADYSPESLRRPSQVLAEKEKCK